MDYRMVGTLSSVVAFLFCQEDEEAIIINSQRRRHRYWMAPYLKDRCDPSQRNTLAKLEMDLIRLGSVDEFRGSLRMPPDIYHELLKKVCPLIQHQHTNYRMCITPEERLSMTMRYLALGDSTRTLHQAYLVGYSTVQPLIRETCRAIYSVLHEEYLRTPSTTEDWLQVADGFSRRWNMPHVIGAVDGKHVRIRCPRNSGSLYYNYKNYYSLVLMAVVDSNYMFLYVDVGAEGRASDSRIWRESKFFIDLQSDDNPLNLPDPTPIPGINGRLPYYFVADDAFALGVNMMKPFPSSHLTYTQRIFNYRLSRCRRIVENGFGILSTRFRILLRQQDMEPEGVKVVVMTAIVLHNFLRSKCEDSYMPRGAADMEDREHSVVEGNWRQEIQLDTMSGHQRIRNTSTFVKNMRNALASWCLSKRGEVPWQYRIVPGHD